jgi:hypothetical protein
MSETAQQIGHSAPEEAAQSRMPDGCLAIPRSAEARIGTSSALASAYHSSVALQVVEMVSPKYRRKWLLRV